MKIQNIFVLAAALCAGAACAQTARVDGVGFPLPVYKPGPPQAVMAPPPPVRSDSNASSTSAAYGGTAYGTQGQSLVVDNHSVAPVATAVAPALISSNDTCMGSTAVGAQGVSFGLSFGTSFTDDNCLMLKNSRELWNMGFRGAALARMCMDDRNRESLEATGVNCPTGRTRGGRSGRD